MNDMVSAVVAYKAIDHYVTSADARLSYRANSEQLEYLRSRDKELAEQSRRAYEQSVRAEYNNRDIIERQLRQNSDEAEYEREHQLELQEREHKMRTRELRAQMKMQQEAMEAQRNIAEIGASVALRNSDLDREARLSMHAKELDQNEQLEIRRMRVQQQLADQNEKLQRYLFEQGVRSTQEIERFKALAMRETQILLARENAQNALHDHMFQEALRTFPLNISPIVLLKNRPHSLTGLLRFSSLHNDKSVLPSVAQVYADVKSYSENPEALNIFIAPIHIDSKIQNRENLSQQIWDSIYQRIESFFIEYYNRRGDHPVILYPTAWKDQSMAGQHASETLHFFLKDMPCMVIEPRFDGQSFSVMLSSWGVGYLSTDHVRTGMKFKVNLDSTLIQSAYERSKKSLEIIHELGDRISSLLSEKRKELEQNVEYYESLQIGKRVQSGEMDEISAIGVYNLFNIDPVQDMASATRLISDLLCVNLAILSDVHHLQATDAAPIFPLLFKNNFPELYEDKELRNLVAKCYERVYIFLRNEDVFSIGSANRKEMERVREMQITNLYKQLELIDASALSDSIDDKLVKYAAERYGIEGGAIEDIWTQLINRMAVDDIPFFKELLPNVEDRRRYKQIDKRISDLSR